MKLRLTDDTLRLRVSPSEVARLSEEGVVETETALGAGPEKRLVYRLALADAIAHPTVVWESTCIVVQLPSDQGRTWATSEVMGLEAVQRFADGRCLAITVEKDFECLHRKAEDADHPVDRHEAPAEARA